MKKGKNFALHEIVSRILMSRNLRLFFLFVIQNNFVTSLFDRSPSITLSHKLTFVMFVKRAESDVFKNKSC